MSFGILLMGYYDLGGFVLIFCIFLNRLGYVVGTIGAAQAPILAGQISVCDTILDCVHNYRKMITLLDLIACMH